MSIASRDGARQLERLIWMKYYIVLKRQITFNIVRGDQKVLPI